MPGLICRKSGYVGRRQKRRRYLRILDSVKPTNKRADETISSLSIACGTQNIDLVNPVSHLMSNQTDILPQEIVHDDENSFSPSNESRIQFSSIGNLDPTEVNKINYDEDKLPDKTLDDVLRSWVLECRPKVSHVDKLLRGLNKLPLGRALPKTYESLMGTPRNLNFRDVFPGKYYHFGVENGVRALLENVCYRSESECFNLDINIDGLPLYKSSSWQFWPILGQIKNFQSYPFIIGIYLGKRKPKSPNDFLKEFVDEMKQLENEGFKIKDKNFSIKIRAIILDAPAKSFIKHVKGHNAYFGCTICVQSGVYEKGRMSYPETDATLRTDASFRNRLDEDHHLDEKLGYCALEELKIDMIESFPLDYMHLLLIGVTKKLFCCGSKEALT